jgi:assimilatory nitrate reductase catalytic subunit
VRTDLEILAALAARLGCGEMFPSDPHVVFDELRRASAKGPADYAGITYERLRRNGGLFWPCPATDHPGTPRLFADCFATGDGRARFAPVQHHPAAEEPDDEFPLYLTTGRLLSHYQSGTQTRRVPTLMNASSHSYVQVHPSIADTIGVQDGDQVRVTTRRGSAVLAAQISPGIRMDTLFVPFHFPGASRANLLTNAALDPQSRMPEFKVCAARLEKEHAC